MTSKLRVVLADLCAVCESIVGPETVVEMTPEEVEKEKKEDSANFFSRVDKTHKATYRQICIVPSCHYC